MKLQCHFLVTIDLQVTEKRIWMLRESYYGAGVGVTVGVTVGVGVGVGVLVGSGVKEMVGVGVSRGKGD